MAIIREVWKYNLNAEFLSIGMTCNSSEVSYISIDTEFPGFLLSAPRHTTPENRYNIMRHNVDCLKPIQLGITFCDTFGKPLPQAWQINLSDFDPAVDPHGESPLALVRRSGLDLIRNHQEGAPVHLVGPLLWRKLLQFSSKKKGWVTFHGMYDIGYFLKLLGFTPLPNTLGEFLRLVRDVLGHIYDVKHFAKFNADYRLKMDIGLVRMASILNVKFDGKAHQAGHDSFLTGSVFYTLKYNSYMKEELYADVLYGLEIEEDGGGVYQF